MKVLLIGAGYMALEYSKVLEALKVEYTVLGRGTKSATIFKEKTGKTVTEGGLEKNQHIVKNGFTHAIVASTIGSLTENTLFLLKNGIKNILVEKPCSTSLQGLLDIETEAQKNNANIYIAYNRRFYSSVLEAKNRILTEGGLTSFLFEFTEWSHVLLNANKTSLELENVFIGNSTHVVDLAFFFGNLPKEMNNYVVNTLPWHPKGSIFAGSGITTDNILFSYHANWDAPGSWKLELLTKHNRYIFRPLEELHVQKTGSVQISKIDIDNSLDINYKPGLYRQLEQFLFGIKHSELLNISRGIEHFKWYEKMYSSKGLE